MCCTKANQVKTVGGPNAAKHILCVGYLIGRNTENVGKLQELFNEIRSLETADELFTFVQKNDSNGAALAKSSATNSLEAPSAPKAPTQKIMMGGLSLADQLKA